ncbi:MAG TPA: polysaccharide deacetylase family protein [Lachnospiraceae bacterium]
MSFQYNDRLVWPEGKRKAFTLSYDDGVEQDIRFIKLLDKYRIKATFNLNSGLFGRPGRVAAGKKEVAHNKLKEEELKEIYKNHELADHGKDHCCMVGMDIACCVEEILEGRKGLEKVLQKPVTGFAYAFGAYDENVIKALLACKIAYARTVKSTGQFSLPENMLTWHPTCHHNDKELNALADSFLSDEIYMDMKSPAKLFYVWGHSYEFDQDDNWDMIDSFLKKMSGHEDVWYATNKEICDYIEAFKRLVFTVDGQFVYNPTATTLFVGGTFTDSYIRVGAGETKELLPKIEM